MRAALKILDTPSTNAVFDYVVAGHEYLADALVASGRLAEAEPAVQKSLDVSGKSSPMAQAGPMMTAADLDAMRGRNASAEERARSAVAKAEKAFGPDGKRTLRSRIRLGRVLVTLGRLDEADALFADVIKADAANAGVLDSAWMNASVQQAKLMVRRGHAADAIPLLANVLKLDLAQPPDQQDLNDEFEYRFALG